MSSRRTEWKGKQSYQSCLVHFMWATHGLGMETTRKLHFTCACIIINPLCMLSWKLYLSKHVLFFVQTILQQITSPVYLLLIWFLYFCLQPFANPWKRKWSQWSWPPPCTFPMCINKAYRSALDLRGLMTLREKESWCVQSINSKVWPPKEKWRSPTPICDS